VKIFKAILMGLMFVAVGIGIACAIAGLIYLLGFVAGDYGLAVFVGFLFFSVGVIAYLTGNYD